jgi:CubicO group peptidase (beta-lactamase class C family)
MMNGKRTCDTLEEIRSFIGQTAQGMGFSGVIHYSKPGILVEEAFGYASRDWRVPNNSLTRFNTASITKVFTACGIVRLAELGLLDIGDRLEKFQQFAGSPFSRDITLYHLLTHTSGIADDADEEAGEKYEELFTDQPNYKFRKASDLVVNFIGKKPVFEPGRGCRYNNAGYVLLGMVIEKVTGQGYTDWIRENILDPWGLNDTCFPSMDEININTAEGYISEQRNGKTLLKKNIYSIPPVGTPEGGIYSTAADLDRLMRGLAEGRFLSCEYSKLMLTPKVHHADHGSIQHWMGFGFEFILRSERIVYLKKDGANPGVSAVMVFYPETETSLVLLSNEDCDVWEMHRRIDAELGLSRECAADWDRGQ